MGYVNSLEGISFHTPPKKTYTPSKGKRFQARKNDDQKSLNIEPLFSSNMETTWPMVSKEHLLDIGTSFNPSCCPDSKKINGGLKPCSKTGFRKRLIHLGSCANYLFSLVFFFICLGKYKWKTKTLTTAVPIGGYQVSPFCCFCCWNSKHALMVVCNPFCMYTHYQNSKSTEPIIPWIQCQWWVTILRCWRGDCESLVNVNVCIFVSQSILGCIKMFEYLLTW